MEYTEINKLIKREIKHELLKCNENFAKTIIEDNKNMKKKTEIQSIDKKHIL